MGILRMKRKYILVIRTIWLHLKGNCKPGDCDNRDMDNVTPNLWNNLEKWEK